MKINQEVVEKAAQFVSQYMAEHLSARFTYHNIHHTTYVVHQTAVLCEALDIGDRKEKLVIIAAWFHDLGYTVQMNEHEKFGADLAQEFLMKHEIDEEDIALVKRAILSTKFPQDPHSKIEKILCDADMLHLKEKDFFNRSSLLRDEWAKTKDRTYTDPEWYRLNYDFLAAHSYQTRYCRKKFDKPKRKNLQALEMLTRSAGMKSESNLPVAENKKIKNSELSKGVETFFRNTSGSHMNLSAMADNKANILLSVSSLIVSVILSFAMRRIMETPHLILPIILLLLICLTTMVLVILATKPKVSKGTFTIEQIKNHEANLLFFGNFHRMDLEMYEWGIREMIHNKEYLYSSMTKDMYYLGKVLAKKYRYLSLAYQVFMYGTIASVISFVISIILTHS